MQRACVTIRLAHVMATEALRRVTKVSTPHGREVSSLLRQLSLVGNTSGHALW
jgi:hypothetical protein